MMVGVRRLASVFILVTTVAMFSYVQSSHDSPKDSGPNKLLLILVDGFRWDYVDMFPSEMLPGFNRLRQTGVSANALIPVFPSHTLTNFYSIFTGLYPESHGLVNNNMYDIKHDEEFHLVGSNPQDYESYWWEDGEPVWITASKQGKSGYFWFLYGCELLNDGHRPTFCSPYYPNPSMETVSLALQDAIAALRTGNDTADLAGVYVQLIDSIGHYLGPDSIVLKFVIKQLDDALVKVLDALDDTTNINLMVFSDHGMASRLGGAGDATSGLINAVDYVNSSDWIRAIGSDSDMQIWPKPDKEECLYEGLRSAHPNMTVYKKEDIPDRYHLKNHHRVPPLLLVADEGYAIVANESVQQLEYIGYSGYDNLRYPNMYGIFFAHGPDFKRGTKFEVSQLSNVDLYQLMCHVMQLEAAPHNGTWANVCDALLDDDTCSEGPYKRDDHSKSD